MVPLIINGETFRHEPCSHPTMHDAIIEKIRKVLALANGKNAYEGEMITALAKAKEMAMRHGIDLATIDINKGQGPTEIPPQLTRI